MSSINFFKAKNKHEYNQKFLTKVPSWEQIIYNIDLNVKKKNKIINRDYYGIEIFNIFDIEEVDKIIGWIKKNNPNHLYSAHAYVSLSEKSHTLGKHFDSSDVWFWQCIGKTKWHVYENNKNYSYIMSPGDFIYVPKNIFHEVIPLTPRVGISFGIDYNDSILKYSY